MIKTNMGVPTHPQMGWWAVVNAEKEFENQKICSEAFHFLKTSLTVCMQFRCGCCVTHVLTKCNVIVDVLTAYEGRARETKQALIPPYPDSTMNEVVHQRGSACLVCFSSACLAYNIFDYLLFWRYQTYA